MFLGIFLSCERCIFSAWRTRLVAGYEQGQQVNGTQRVEYAFLGVCLPRTFELNLTSIPS